MRVDAHQHFWRYEAASYPWISPKMVGLKRDFLPGDLEPLLAAAGMDGSVAVQARQSLEETQWLLELAGRHDFVLGVVGWVPLRDAEIERIVSELAGTKGFVGARHVLQDEADDFLEDAAFGRGIDALGRYGVPYDVLVYARQLPAAIEFVDRHPGQTFVLDHCGKPPIAKSEMDAWAADLRRIAEREHCCCKLSGQVTEANWASWSLVTLEPYVETALGAFGPDRLMFGSDWPVCTVASSYERWVGAVAKFTRRLSDDERSAVWGETAARVYGLSLGGVTR